MSLMSLNWIQSKGQLLSLPVLPSACLAALLLHNRLLIGVKMCLCSLLTALSNLNLKAIRLRSERSVYERERKKKWSAILGYSEPFHSKVTFQTKCLLRYLGHRCVLLLSRKLPSPLFLPATAYN